jgi:hypothetical protein
MTKQLRWTVLATSMAGLILATLPLAVAGDEKALIGSYRLAKRTTLDGKERTDPELIGFMTFTKGYRTVIMKWSGSDAKPVSIAFIGSYKLAGGQFCESVVHGANGDLGAPGVTYDTPSTTPACTAAASDAAGLTFDIPSEKLHLRVTRDGIVATTPRWVDHWEKLK